MIDLVTRKGKSPVGWYIIGEKRVLKKMLEEKRLEEKGRCTESDQDWILTNTHIAKQVRSIPILPHSIPILPHSIPILANVFYQKLHTS